MLVTLFGIVTSVKLVHLEKALIPMLVTLFPSISCGTSIDVAFVLQPIISISPASVIR